MGGLILCKLLTLESAAPFFLPLSALFALHIIPYAGNKSGLPDRIVGELHPPKSRCFINPLGITMVLIGVATACAGLYLRRSNPMVGYRALVWGYGFILTQLMGAAALEWLAILRKMGETWTVPREGNLPLSWSGHDPYSQLGFPALGYAYVTLVSLALGLFMYSVTSHKNGAESAVGEDSVQKSFEDPQLELKSFEDPER